MARSIIALWILVMVFASGGLLLAQDPTQDPLEDPYQDPPPDPERKIPDLEKIRKTRMDEAIRDPALADPALLVDIYKDSLRHWPRHPQGEEAVRQLLRGGKGLVPQLLALIDEKERDYRLKPAVAYILGRMECREAVPKIESLLYDRKLRSSARVFLQALYRIDTPYTENLCLKLISSENTVLRQAAFSILKTSAEPVQSPVLNALLESPKGEIRRNAFILLSRAPGEELDKAALSLVGDDQAQLASEVAAYLSTRNNAMVTEGLKGMLTFEMDRSFAFALTILVMMENQTNMVILEKDHMANLEKLLQNRDPLFRVSAGSALGNICYRSGTEADLNLIRNRIVPAFMEVFLQNRYFKDFNCMLGIAAETLQRVTGYPFSRDLTYWRSWWNKEGRSFVEKQFLITVHAPQLPMTLIHHGNGETRIGRTGEGETLEGGRFILAGQGMLEQPDDGRDLRVFYLDDQEMGIIVDLFYTEGFFQFPSAPLPTGGEADKARFIAMEVDNRVRCLHYAPEREKAFSAMEKRLQVACDSNRWQILYPGGNLKQWWENRYTWWKDEADDKARSERLVVDLLDGFNVLPDEVILECISWIIERGDYVESLPRKRCVLLLTKLDKRWNIDPVVRAVTNLISATRNKDLLEPLITFLYSTYGEKAQLLMVKAVRELDCIDECLADERWFLRAAGAGAVQVGDTNRIPVLEILLEDDRIEVRHAALRSLVTVNTGESRDRVREIMAQDSEYMKQVLLEAMIELEDSWVLDLFEGVLQSDEATLWPLALEGLTRFNSRRAAEVAERFFRKENLPPETARLGLTALERMGGEPARNILLQLLDDCKDPDTEVQVIFALAGLGETRVFPKLGDLMLNAIFRDRAVEAMAFLLVADYGSETWLYRERWEKHVGENQAFFLKSSLGIEGGVAAKGPYFDGIPASALVTALRSDAWPVRLAALRILEEGASRSFGALGKDASSEEIHQVAQAWEGWLQG